MTAEVASHKRILRQVLLWNLGLFSGLGVAGWMADSSALLANALDNGSDAAVYLLSYIAIDRRPAWKRGAASVSGVMLLLFAAAVMADVVRRWLYGAEPLGPVMMVLALVAAAINMWCLVLLRRIRSDDVNMKAAETFSLNDFISNGGVIVAGGLVLWLGTSWPDLVAGALIAAVAFKGGIEILKSVREDRQSPE
ncbi:cation transporter [Novilysobacter avium]|uniref:Cation transporter n=1 Tax=Novilysobacter avium TaxID=2781023 RepID=A0A7S6UK38_9GAMM|nr:cation transporter [Lysobacter avium]QOW21776.1 cation transporter [Lysobacter avium]